MIELNLGQQDPFTVLNNEMSPEDFKEMISAAYMVASCEHADLDYSGIQVLEDEFDDKFSLYALAEGGWYLDGEKPLKDFVLDVDEVDGYIDRDGYDEENNLFEVYLTTAGFLANKIIVSGHEPVKKNEEAIRTLSLFAALPEGHNFVNVSTGKVFTLLSEAKSIKIHNDGYVELIRDFSSMGDKQPISLFTLNTNSVSKFAAFNGEHETEVKFGLPEWFFYSGNLSICHKRDNTADLYRHILDLEEKGWVVIAIAPDLTNNFLLHAESKNIVSLTDPNNLTESTVIYAKKIESDEPPCYLNVDSLESAYFVLVNPNGDIVTPAGVFHKSDWVMSVVEGTDSVLGSYFKTPYRNVQTWQLAFATLNQAIEHVIDLENSSD